MGNSSSKQFYEQNESQSHNGTTPQIHIHLDLNQRHSKTIQEDSSSNTSSNSSSSNQTQDNTPLELSKTTPDSETVRNADSSESVAISKIAGLMISFVAIML